jgi:hypothetical protein
MAAIVEDRPTAGERSRSGATARIEEWTLSEETVRLWTAASVALSIAGLVLFALVFAAWHGSIGFPHRGWQLLGAVLLTTVLTLPLYVVHEWIHGLTMRRFGARPTYGSGRGPIGGVPGYLYCTANGARFTRRQFAAIALAPAVVLSALGTLAIAALPWGGWLVVPLAFHFGGCVGDFWAVGLVLRRPRGTLIEDRESGVRFHLPPV